MKALAICFTFAALTTFALAQPEPITLSLWPEGAPGQMPRKSEATVKLLESYGQPSSNLVTDVTEPTITVYRPDKPNGTAVIVAPGGAYTFLSWVHEGTQVCEWLNGLGVTAVLLKYRTPTRDDREASTLPVQDGQRAIGLVRHRAKEWNVDPTRVGILGFSAGANLAGHVAWDRSPRTYPQQESMDDPRPPDFLIFIYGSGFLDREDKTKFRTGFRVPDDAPPAFFLVAHDDKAASVEAAIFYLEYRKRGFPSELHIYTKGGHGFGMRRTGHPISDWPQRCAEWMKSMELLDAKAPASGSK